MQTRLVSIEGESFNIGDYINIEMTDDIKLAELINKSNHICEDLKENTLVPTHILIFILKEFSIYLTYNNEVNYDDIIHIYNKNKISRLMKTNSNSLRMKGFLKSIEYEENKIISLRDLIKVLFNFDPESRQLLKELLLLKKTP